MDLVWNTDAAINIRLDFSKAVADQSQYMEATKTELRHEGGHFYQLLHLGVFRYFIGIGFPSARSGGAERYYSQPWEVTADVFAGVFRENEPFTTHDIILGLRYLEYLRSINGPMDWIRLLSVLPDTKNHNVPMFEDVMNKR